MKVPGVKVEGKIGAGKTTLFQKFVKIHYPVQTRVK